MECDLVLDGRHGRCHAADLKVAHPPYWRMGMPHTWLQGDLLERLDLGADGCHELYLWLTNGSVGDSVLDVELEQSEGLAPPGRASREDVRLLSHVAGLRELDRGACAAGMKLD